MKKTNFTIQNHFLIKGLTFMLVILLVTVTGTSLNAQNEPCSLACNGTTNVSLDNQCEALITPEMILNDDATSCPDGVFSVQLMTEINGSPIPGSPTVTSAYVGTTLFVKVLDETSGNSCWGELLVEDKIGPQIICPTITAPVLCYNQATAIPTATDNCEVAPEVVVIGQPVVQANNCDGSLPDNVIKRVTTVYQAVDLSGRRSETCSVTVDVERIPSLDDIVAPMSFIADDALACNGTYAKDEAGYPSVDFAGVPTILGVPLYPTPYSACGIAVTKEDIPLPSIGCVKKLMRVYNIVEWTSCGAPRTREIVQMFEIVDNEGPVITQCAQDFIASTNGHECTAYVNLPAIVASDACDTNTDLEVDITYEGGFLDNSNGGLVELPVGESIVTYRVYDECLNSTECSITVTVADNTPPVAICDQFTAVGLTNDGYAHVNASVFDDGSYDECQLDRMLVRRMDNTNCAPCDAPTFTGFTSLGSYEGHYYYLSDARKNGRLANKHAVALGGYAVSLETAAERTWLDSKVPVNTPYYIGLTNNGGSTYSWASGAALTQSDWDIYQPDYNEPYVVSENGSYGDWSDVDGSELNRYIIEIDDPCSYSEITKVCCADIGNETMVVFRVIDEACNFNECMVNVEVQDKIGPVVSCPTDVTVSCETPYDVNNMSQFGDVTVFDNCGFSQREVVSGVLDQCQTGDLFRKFIVTDDGGRMDSCIQKITFAFDFDFDYNRIEFPRDTVINTGCDDPSSPEFDAANLGLPNYPDTPCQLLGLNMDDQVFVFNGNDADACFKILRTFTVINWCEEDVNGIPVTYTGSQVIKVNNLVAPTITGSCERVMACTYDSECQDGAITLTQTAEDDCTTALNYSYRIDAWNDGIFDGAPVEGVGNMADASGVYPIGSHRIVWTFFDRCGNTTSCEQLFDVVNCKAPTPYCLNGLAIDLMPNDANNDGVIDGGMIDIWANDFDAGSSHPCGYDVILSFSADTSDQSRFFFCGDVGEQEVNVYSTSVAPDGTLLQAFCVTYVDVQDNMNACGNNNEENRSVIEGHIATVNEEVLDEVRVDLIGADAYEMTQEGAYAFPEMPLGGDYTVDPVKNDDTNNGVSTLDLVLIQRHIINLQNLDSPYKLLAADINRDDMLSASDIVELRKVILGIADEFPSNDSWRFIDANFAFADATNPWATQLPEEYNVQNLDQDMIVDFTAIKVGDVNNSAITNSLSSDANTEVRYASTLALAADVSMINEGISTIPVLADQDIDIAGIQMTIELAEGLSYVTAESANLTFSESNIGTRYTDRGIVTLSWGNTQGVSIKKGDVLFNLVVDAQNKVANALNVTSTITVAEAFDTNHEVMNVEISLRDASATEGYALMQNSPNPFNNYTQITYTLPEAMNTTITVYDMNGRTLKTISSNGDKGINTITLNKADLSVSGVLYYQLQAGDFTANRKMVVFN